MNASLFGLFNPKPINFCNCQKSLKIYHNINSNHSIKKAFIINSKMASLKNVKYAKISLKKREKLVELVSRSDMPTSKAARMLGLKLSTAKLIIKRFRQEGSFFESKKAKQKRLAIEKSEERGEIIEENGEILRREDQVHEEMEINATPSILDETIMSSYLWNPLFWSPESILTYYWNQSYLLMNSFQ